MGAKTDASTTKYEIKASFEIDGVVEKPDIIGGIYGQTDGLLSENLDIRELQKTGRIGRISVELSSKKGKTTGRIIIPSSLSRMETAILAATLETVDRVGPCSCSVKLEEIIDVRVSKRQTIVDRASAIIREWDQNVSPFSSSISMAVKKSSKSSQVVSLGDEGFSAGPGFEKQKKTILVEGRADVINLLKFGVNNTVAVNGTSISPQLIDLIAKKTVTAFLDGDRGGDLILKELLQVSHVEFVARAPKGKEVEDLNETETKKSLKEAVPLEKAVFLTGRDADITVKEFLDKSKPQKKRLKKFSLSRKETEVKKPKPTTKKVITAKTAKTETVRKDIEQKVTRKPSTTRPTSTTRRPSQASTRTRYDSRSGSRPSSRPSTRTYDRDRPTTSQRPPRREIRKVELPDYLTNAVKEVKTKLEAIVFDEKQKEILRSSAAKIFESLEKIEKGSTLVIDGIITQRLLDRSNGKGIKTVIGARKGEISKKPTSLKIIEFKQI
ncbi:MAG: DNA primase [Candidatus Heimdallarchaeota archaeon]|nr:DNA primase [Candidatus Heimdallarchaeota archaeon]MCK5143580.1 DNA primase [Candidatus Heimdallarchaeota archaeon]